MATWQVGRIELTSRSWRSPFGVLASPERPAKVPSAGAYGHPETTRLSNLASGVISRKRSVGPAVMTEELRPGLGCVDTERS
jgi:hypothetical protein